MEVFAVVGSHSDASCYMFCRYMTFLGSLFRVILLDTGSYAYRLLQSLTICVFCCPAVGGRRFRYLFYVDFVGNLADDLPQNALRHLQEMTDFMRVLGCYPMHRGVESA